MESTIVIQPMILSPILVGTKFGEDFFKASYRRNDEVLDLPSIHINCELREYETTPCEKAIMQTNGYVRAFDCLIAGWDIWVLSEDFKTIKT